MKYWIIFSAVILFASCGGDGDTNSDLSDTLGTAEVDLNPTPDVVEEAPVALETIVKGTITESTGSLLQLGYMAQYGLESKGTSTIAEDGSFSFTFNPDQPGFYNVRFAEDNSLLLYLEPGSVTEFTASGANLFDTYNLITAGNDSKLLQKFFIKSNAFYKELQEINVQMDALSFSDDKGRKKFIKSSEAKRANFNAFKTSFIDDNISSPTMVFMMDHLDALTEQEYIAKIEKAVKESLPANSHYRTYIEQAAQNKTKEYLMSTAATRIQPGKMAPDIEFPDPNGQMISLSSLQGKIVLLDFWASWCRPCRAENPNVVRMYNEYKDKGFEIFSFSLDQDQAKWTNAIQKDGLVWNNHSSDLKGWNTEVLPLYGFQGIPFTVLLDRDGKIIETNLRGQALENKLKTILG